MSTFIGPSHQPPPQSPLPFLHPQECWRQLVERTAGKLTEKELGSLSWSTLQTLMPIFGVAEGEEREGVELVWREIQQQEQLNEEQTQPTPIQQTGPPHISEIPRPSRSVSIPFQESGGMSAAAPLATPMSMNDTFSPITMAWRGVDDDFTIVLQKEKDIPLGMAFKQGTLMLVGCTPGTASAANPKSMKFIGKYLVEVNGSPVTIQQDVLSHVDSNGGCVVLKFADKPTRIEVPPIPAVFQVDTPSISTSVMTPKRRSRSKGRVKPFVPVQHPHEFEIETPRKGRSLSRRRRLATDMTGTSNPNNVNGGGRKDKQGGKSCYSPAATKNRSSSMGDYKMASRKIARSGRTERLTVNPNVTTAPQYEVKVPKSNSTKKYGSDSKIQGSGNPNDIGREDFFLTGEGGRQKFPHDLSASCNPNSIEGTADPYARDATDFNKDEGSLSWMLTLPKRIPLAVKEAASCNVNDAGVSHYVDHMSQRRHAPARKDHGPPGIWPNGKYEKSGGLRISQQYNISSTTVPAFEGRRICSSPAKVENISGNWSLVPGAIAATTPKKRPVATTGGGMRFISSATWLDTATGKGTREC